MYANIVRESTEAGSFLIEGARGFKFFSYCAARNILRLRIRGIAKNSRYLAI